MTIDTNTLTFGEFSIPGQTTAANVGSGVGQVFRDKTGVTLNLKTILAGTHMVITNNANDITLATDATNNNTASTLVARDGSGNFSAGTIVANLTGSASNNLLKAGDTMTGNLNLALQSMVRLQDGTGSGNFVGINAPSTVGSSYTVNLPASAPVAGQYLQASSPSSTQWTTIGGLPAATQTLYVAKNGNDSNNGSLVAPFLTVKQAVTSANAVATTNHPIVINIGPGVFVEDNSGGPITITADGISIVGSSTSGTILVPAALSNDLFTITTANVEFLNITMTAGGVGSTARAVNLNTNIGEGGFHSVLISEFQTGISLNAAGGSPIIVLDNILSQGNGTSISINNLRTIIQNSLFLGPMTGSTPSNAGVSVTGTTALVTMLGNSFRLMNTGVSITGGANMRMIGNNIETTTNGLVCNGGSNSTLVGCNVILNNVGSINVVASGANTSVTVDGCHFQCSDALGIPQGTALQATTGASIFANSCTIENAITGIQSGTTGDTNTTAVRASSVILKACTTDIQQTSTATLSFIAGSFETAKLSIANPTNVNFAAFDANDTLAIGDDTDGTQALYEVINGQALLPSLVYEPNYYGNKGTIYKNQNSDATINGTQAASNDASYYVITGSRTNQASINLISDAGNIGVNDNVRGWNIAKVGTSANLDFNYSNNDISGQASRGSNAVLQLNGFDNQVEFPAATNAPLPTNTVAKLVWAGDTNLYRSAANTLKTDSNFIVGGLTPNTVLTSNTSQQLVSSPTTSTELGYLSGVTSSIQSQINNKVTKTGDTMTGALTLPAGTTSIPSLNFSVSPTTGLSSNNNNLSISTAGSERIKISSLGNVSINGFTSTGILHNDASGNLTTSLITNADIDPAAAISDSKLATITTSGKVANSATTATNVNTASALVSRDSSGNFAAGTISATLAGAATLNVLRAGDTMTGPLTVPAGTAAVPSIQFSGSTNLGISAAVTNTLSFDANGVEQMNVSPTGVVLAARLVLQNLLCNQAKQSVVPTEGGSITVNSSTSILILNPATLILNFTVTFPPNPTDGQFFTILLGTNNTINLTNAAGAGAASIVNNISQLSLTAPAASIGGTSVTYMYIASANSWYRFNRG